MNTAQLWKSVARSALLLLLICFTVIALEHWRIRRAGAPASLPAASTTVSAGWGIFDASRPEVVVSQRPLREQLRLIAIYNAQQNAVIELRSNRIVRCYTKSDRVEIAHPVSVILSEIGPDFVKLQCGEHDVVELRLRDYIATGTAIPGGVARSAADTSNAPAFMAETNRFGVRTDFNRYSVKRSELMGYYDELTRDPERLENLYVSMEPNWNGDLIEGYRLNPTGEKDFFEAVGLKPGDTVRKVNSMEMRNKGRAQYLINEFLKQRLELIVLDVERNGKTEQLIYDIN